MEGIMEFVEICDHHQTRHLSHMALGSNLYVVTQK